MPELMKKALGAYARTILQKGWKAGEPIIEQQERQFKEFRRWAYALGLMLRIKELLS